MEVFNNEQFGSVRIIEEGNKYLFCGLDVAAALGYAKPRNAITAHYRCALKRGVPIRTPKVTNRGQIYFVNKFLKEAKGAISCR